MRPRQVAAIAAACAERDPQWRAFILVQGVIGMRPGEARALRVRDINHRDGELTSVTIRKSHTAVGQRFLGPSETNMRPLKGRGEKHSRTVPLPDYVIQPIDDRLRRPDDEPDALLFTNGIGGPINPSNFTRDVWGPARAAVFSAGTPLAGVTLHDLRHSAIATWLNSGVVLKTAQLWSGHKTVSVLLDTYLGVMEGDDAVSLSRLEGAINQEAFAG